MNKEKTGGAAFPITISEGSSYTEHLPHDGMTLLDYFAAKAMQGVLSNASEYSEVRDEITCAVFAYKQAAAMLEERKKYMNK